MIPGIIASQAGGGGGGGSTYPLAATFLAGDNGCIFSAKYSRAYIDSAMTTVCAVSGSDPFGAWEDLSGLGNHALQTTSANKPVFYSGSGWKWPKGGTISGVGRWLNLPVMPVAGATLFLVFRVSSSSAAYIALMAIHPSILDNTRYLIYDGTLRNWPGNVSVFPVPTVGSAHSFMRLDVPGVGTAVYSKSGVDFTDMGSAVLSYAARADAASMILGADASGLAEVELAFMYYNTRVLTDDEIALVKAQIVAELTGW